MIDRQLTTEADFFTDMEKGSTNEEEKSDWMPSLLIQGY